MFSGIAGSEIFLIVVIGLIVLGPKRLPQVANQLGSWVGQARRMTRMMKRQLEGEINIDLNSINKPIDIEKGLMGLADADEADKKNADTKTAASVSRPEYVHDRSKTDASSESDDDDTEELPDDYSPAHGPEEAGTGVGDDDYISDDELEPVVAASDDGLAENDPEDAAAVPDEPKKETA